MDDVFAGAQRPHLPDLVVTWDDEARVLGEIESEACGRIRGPAGYQVAPYYTGNHRPNAFVVAAGPSVEPGSEILEGHVLDLAPTVFALLGAEPPPHFEGRAWAGVVSG
jgi:hypothetical protein